MSGLQKRDRQPEIGTAPAKVQRNWYPNIQNPQ